MIRKKWLIYTVFSCFGFFYSFILSIRTNIFITAAFTGIIVGTIFFFIGYLANQTILFIFKENTSGQTDSKDKSDSVETDEPGSANDRQEHSFVPFTKSSFEYLDSSDVTKTAKYVRELIKKEGE